MRWWNKSKKYKDAGWYAVKLPDPTYHFKILKVWCQQQPGRGRFYYSLYKNAWYFELAKDASWFILKWM